MAMAHCWAPEGPLRALIEAEIGVRDASDARLLDRVERTFSADVRFRPAVRCGPGAWHVDLDSPNYRALRQSRWR